MLLNRICRRILYKCNYCKFYFFWQFYFSLFRTATTWATTRSLNSPISCLSRTHWRTLDICYTKLWPRLVSKKWAFCACLEQHLCRFASVQKIKLSHSLLKDSLHSLIQRDMLFHCSLKIVCVSWNLNMLQIHYIFHRCVLKKKIWKKNSNCSLAVTTETTVTTVLISSVLFTEFIFLDCLDEAIITVLYCTYSVEEP